MTGQIDQGIESPTASVARSTRSENNMRQDLF